MTSCGCGWQPPCLALSRHPMRISARSGSEAFDSRVSTSVIIALASWDRLMPDHGTLARPRGWGALDLGRDQPGHKRRRDRRLIHLCQ
jgi:hypothetical protein